MERSLDDARQESRDVHDEAEVESRPDSSTSGGVRRNSPPMMEDSDVHDETEPDSTTSGSGRSGPTPVPLTVNHYDRVKGILTSYTYTPIQEGKSKNPRTMSCINIYNKPKREPPTSPEWIELDARLAARNNVHRPLITDIVAQRYPNITERSLRKRSTPRSIREIHYYK